jgi:hypothetical protein
MSTKTIINLFELQEMYQKKFEIEKMDYPMELAPAWNSYCRKYLGVWRRQKLIRMSQMEELGIADTHEIDYYMVTSEISPF